MKRGDLALQGWMYHIGSGIVTAYDDEKRTFLTPAEV
jgi:hypothetical protein